MGRNMYKKIIMVVLMACLMPLAAAAQSASKFYSDGMAQYNKGKYSEAITLFKKSIAIDGSKTNTANCNAMIKKCNQKLNPSNSSKHKSMSDSSNDGTYPAEWKEIKVDATPKTGRREFKAIHPKGDKWEYELVGDKPWVHIEKVDQPDDKALYFTFDSNNSNTTRTATVNVMHDGRRYPITITQSGLNTHSTTVSPLPKTIRYVQRKETYLLLTGLKGNTKASSTPEWMKQLDYKYKKPNVFQSFLKIFGVKPKLKITNLEPGEAAFSVELYYGEDRREGDIVFEGVEQFRVIQASSK
jgi:hypothetical protein